MAISDFTLSNIESYIRILHASPNAPPVDVYANDVLIASNLKYREFTKYLPISSGAYIIKVYPTGKKDNLVLATNIYIPRNKIYTIAAINKVNNLALLPIEDPQILIAPNKTYVRFVHLAPNAPSVDVKTKEGKALFKDISYKEISNYVPLDPGMYYINVYPVNSNKIVLAVPNIRFRPNKAYTIYAIGLVGEEPGLQVLIPLDGNSYIKFKGK